MVIERRKADSNSINKFSRNVRTRCNSALLADSNGSNPSSRCAYYIPDDLLIEVLSRLSWKALLKFMFVSKSWHNLISNFIPTSPTSPMSGLLLYSAYCDRFHDVSMAFLRSGCSTRNCLEVLQSRWASLRTSHPRIEVIHYCNGLFLLFDGRAFGRFYYVCNPATNQCVPLPEREPLSEPEPPSAWPANYSALVFDPKRSNHFKVVYMFCNSYNQAIGQIFSSDKNQWVSFSAYLSDCCPQDHFVARQSIYLNGALHYLRCLDACMITFFVEKKLLREFRKPRKLERLAAERLGESDGHLFYAATYPAKLQIWMMESFDTGKWFKKHTLHIANMENAISPSFPFDYSSVMAFHPNLEVLFICHLSVVYSYYFGSGWKDAHRLKEVCRGFDSIVEFVYPYSPCLASLNDVCNQRST